MDTLKVREKINHFLAINQINVAEFKHLLGTVMLFISAGGLNKLFLTGTTISNTYYTELFYYAFLIFFGTMLYLKFL